MRCWNEPIGNDGAVAQGSRNLKRDPLGLHSPVFRQLWRRVAIVGLCFGWSLLELYWNSPFWFILFFALAIYLAYEFFVKFDPENYQENSSERPDE